MADETPKPPRAPRQPREAKRRDFATIVKNLEAYATATIDVLQSQPTTEFGAGQIAFATKVLDKLKGAK